jgi:DnaJ-class molecular chaperone
MDILKMASQIAENMSAEDKHAIENMDMEKMISHVTQTVFGMLGTAPPMTNSARPLQVQSVSGLPRTRDICFDLSINLEEFYMGKKKKLNVKRRRIVEENGRQRVVEEKKKITIPIEKGMKDEHQIRFEGEADQIPGYTPGDIIITLIANEHETFQRDNDNLIMIKNINLYEAYSLTFDVTHLDGRVVRITKSPQDALHLHDSLRKVSGQGMPIFKSQNNEYGDLFIRFNIVIPISLEPSRLEKLKEVFHTETSQLDASVEVSAVCQLENVSESDLEELSDSETESSISDSEDSDSEESEDSESL